jgi:hypothetical protein
VPRNPSLFLHSHPEGFLTSFGMTTNGCFHKLRSPCDFSFGFPLAQQMKTAQGEAYATQSVLAGTLTFPNTR